VLTCANPPPSERITAGRRKPEYKYAVRAQYRRRKDVHLKRGNARLIDVGCRYRPTKKPPAPTSLPVCTVNNKTHGALRAFQKAVSLRTHNVPEGMGVCQLYANYVNCTYHRPIPTCDDLGYDAGIVPAGADCLFNRMAFMTLWSIWLSGYLVGFSVILLLTTAIYMLLKPFRRR